MKKADNTPPNLVPPPEVKSGALAIKIENNTELDKQLEHSLLILKPDSFHKIYPKNNTSMAEEIMQDILRLCLHKKAHIPISVWINFGEFKEADFFLNNHYIEHYTGYTKSKGAKKTFYPKLVQYMKGQLEKEPTPALLMVVEGPAGTIQLMREFGLYEIRGHNKEPFTEYTSPVRSILNIRTESPKYYAFTSQTRNMLHISANTEEANHEVANLLQTLSSIK